MSALKALAAQLGALALVLSGMRLGLLALAPWSLAALQGVLAATLALLLRSDRWWLWLHLGFGPAIVLAAQRQLPAWGYLLPLCLLLLVYGSSFRTQVPLFLSNRATVEKFAAWLPADTRSVLDAGSGTGSFALSLARLRTDCSVTGMEQAQLPALLGRWNARGAVNARLRRGDFWQENFADYDAVYAFLSPVPMQALWEEASAEMRAGSWLVSNSFVLPGRDAEEVLQVDDRRGTRLYCYRIPVRSAVSRAGNPLGRVTV